MAVNSFLASSLKPGLCHVVTLRISELAHLRERLTSVLCADELARAQRFHFDKDTLCYIISHSVLRLLLGFYLDEAPYSLAFSEGEFKKPKLQDNAGYTFNLSHSGDYVAYAFTCTPVEVGVDIERHKSTTNFLELAERFFHPNELKWLISQAQEGECERAFYRLWTGKEAFIKAIGMGMHFPLDDCEFGPSKEEDFTLLRVKESLVPSWFYHAFPAPEGYSLALVTNQSNLALSLWDSGNNWAKIVESLL